MARYSYEMDDGLALIYDAGGRLIGRALTERDAQDLLTEMNGLEHLRDRLVDAVTDAIEEAFE